MYSEVHDEETGLRTALPRSSFRLSSFDAWSTFYQILLLISAYHVAFCVAILLLSLLDLLPLTLDNIFDKSVSSLQSSPFTLETVPGWCLTLTQLALALVAAALLRWIVARAKLCLDFGITLHLFHLLFTLIHCGGWPKSILFYILRIASVCLTCFLGEWWCLQAEMQPILLAGSSNLGTNQVGNSSTNLYSKLKRFVQDMKNTLWKQRPFHQHDPNIE